jgi:hypothetical protein
MTFAVMIRPARLRHVAARREALVAAEHFGRTRP